MTYHYKGHTKDFVLVDEGRHGRHVVEDGPVERNQCNLLNLAEDQFEEVEGEAVGTRKHALRQVLVAPENSALLDLHKCASTYFGFKVFFFLKKVEINSFFKYCFFLIYLLAKENTIRKKRFKTVDLFCNHLYPYCTIFYF